MLFDRYPVSKYSKSLLYNIHIQNISQINIWHNDTNTYFKPPLL